MSLVSAFRAAALLACLSVSASVAVSAPLASPCKVSDEHLSLDGKLDRAAAELKAGGAFRILVIGSSSTAGVGASAPERSYTRRLQEELKRRLAGVDVSVVARGIGGETASGAEARLVKEIAATKPDLVIWQIGTNDAERGVAVESFRATTARGLAAVAKTGVDVAMLDPQFVPEDEALYAPYITAIDALSEATGVPVAQRYAAMQAIEKSGGGAMISRDRLHMNDFGHACVGAFLAEALDRKLAPIPAVAAAGRAS